MSGVTNRNQIVCSPAKRVLPCDSVTTLLFLTMQKKAAPKASKAAAKAPLAPTTSHNITQQGGKAIEEIYQKKSQLEHILLRPDTYIGSTEKQQQTLWVHDGEKMVFKNITYAPGLFKIFDEILVNAADNKVRDASMDTIRVDISPVSSSIRMSASCIKQDTCYVVVLERCPSAVVTQSAASTAASVT